MRQTVIKLKNESFLLMFYQVDDCNTGLIISLLIGHIE